MKKKKLLVLSNLYPFKSYYKGTFVSEQIKYQKKNFNEINVISPFSYFPKFLLKFKKFRNYSTYNSYPTNYIDENVNIYFPKHFTLPKGDMDIIMKMRGNLSLLSVKKLIDKEKIDIDLIHSHFIYPSGYIGSILKEELKKPFIITAHGGDIYNQPFKSSFNFQSTCEILKKADRIITTSNNNSLIITERMGISRDKVQIIPNGFDENKFFPMDKILLREKLGIPKKSIIILSVGNLVKIKGHKYLIDAMSKICKVEKNIMCYIIGAGVKKNLDDQIKFLGLENNVKVISGLNHDYIARWMNACDIFVLPSLDEGSPTVIAEALGCGKPVVATSVGNIPNMINKDLGILVKAKNSEDLANGILKALSKEWDNNKILEEAKKHYTWKVISKQIYNIYSHFI